MKFTRGVGRFLLEMLQWAVIVSGVVLFGAGVASWILIAQAALE